ncbi:hypothetical protein J8J14_23600 [Roseomonas sp. SSH11]|uniref:Antitoxin-like ribbon-helix-helix domain-containing protein n=1 Tax=Pararoseomonas baculiformis TaxID=2820812 RepID=A0ABS4AL41_9PROT|nr:ribbon-helix-helix domain-containing protein [Pararoseomonas baculiformis]MBP0447740.1 hypothetical protein [Pararoseomonas baculiformis]
MSKPNFAAGLKALRPEAAPSPAPVTTPPLQTAQAPSRAGKVAISAYFEPEVRKQLAIMAARQDKSQAALIAEALNMLFEHYGESPIARA